VVRCLEEQLIRVPSVDEYLDASNREGVRASQARARRLAPHGFDGDYLFTEGDRRMLAEDATEWREKDRETVEAWYRAQGIVPELEGAEEKLLAKLEGRSK